MLEEQQKDKDGGGDVMDDEVRNADGGAPDRSCRVWEPL